MKTSNGGMFARRGSGRIGLVSPNPKTNWKVPGALLFSVCAAVLVGIQLDRRTESSTQDYRASLRRESANSGARSEQWAAAYHVNPSSPASSVIDTQGSPYLLGGVRTVNLRNENLPLVSKQVESQFSLVAPGSFIEFNLAGDRNGHYIMRLTNRVVSLYFAVMNQDRLEISTLNLHQPISGTSLTVNADGQCSLSSKAWRVALPGCSNIKGISSYSTNLLSDEIEKLDFVTGATK